MNTKSWLSLAVCNPPRPLGACVSLYVRPSSTANEIRCIAQAIRPYLMKMICRGCRNCPSLKIGDVMKISYKVDRAHVADPWRRLSLSRLRWPLWSFEQETTENVSYASSGHQSCDAINVFASMFLHVIQPLDISSPRWPCDLQSTGRSTLWRHWILLHQREWMKNVAFKREKQRKRFIGMSTTRLMSECWVSGAQRISMTYAGDERYHRW